jgi:ribosomal protein L37AE/L43A
MARSRESVRENKAMQSILRGETPEKRIFVATTDKEFKEKMRLERESDRKRTDEKLEATKEARMPWFCPSCDKIMKKRLDEKMWYLYTHCFDCQIKVENKMRIDGTYDSWATQKIIANKLSWIREQKQQLTDFKNQEPPVYYNQINPDGHSITKEKWNMKFEQTKKDADEALKHLQKIEDSLL